MGLGLDKSLLSGLGRTCIYKAVMTALMTDRQGRAGESNVESNAEDTVKVGESRRRVKCDWYKKRQQRVFR